MARSKPRPDDLHLDAMLDTARRLEQQVHKPNINRYVPQAQQDPFHRSQTKHRIATGGNRSGKTYCSVADDVLVQLRKHPFRQHFYPDRPLVGRIVGVDFDRGIAQGIVPLLQQFLPPSALINGSWEDSYRPSEHMLFLTPEYGKISLMSYEQDPDKFQIVALDWVHFDEEPPHPIFRESQLRVIDSGGTITISQTPVQQMEWLQDEIIDPVKDGTRTDFAVFELDTRKNPHLNQAAVAELDAGLDEEEKKIRFEGQYTGSSLVFPEFTRKYPNIIPPQPISRFRPEYGWIIYESMDYGYANPTAWLWTAVNRDGSIVTFHEEEEPRVVIEEWARRVLAYREEIRRAIGDSSWMPAGTFGDPSISRSDNGQTGVTNQQMYARAGVGIATHGIVALRTGNQNIGLDRMHTYLLPRPPAAGSSASTGQKGEPWWQITEDCPKLAGEMRKARKPPMTLKQKEVKNSSEQIRDKDNHGIDAVKYLFMSLPDLRPQAFQLNPEDGSSGFGAAAQYAHAAPPPPATHADAWQATMSPDSRSVSSSDYSTLEG